MEAENCPTCALAHRNNDAGPDEDDGGVEHPYVAHYKQARNLPSALTLAQFSRLVYDLQKTTMPTYRPIEIQELPRTLFESILFPELSKGVKFPSTFQMPTYTFQQKNSFLVSTNAAGNAFIQVNFGQYLDASTYKTGAPGSQNGNSTVGNSNVFICNDTTLTGASAPLNTACRALDTMMVNNGMFNAIRPGTASVKYEYVGRLDISAGTVSMGLNYTALSDPQAAVPCNGLLPDPQYSTIQALEDCPFARTAPSLQSMKAVYVPHDYNALNLRSPTDAQATMMPQRLFILIIGAPPNQNVGRITITHNWEGTPTRAMADIVNLTYNTFPSSFDGKEIYDYMITNNLIITQSEKEAGINKFMKTLSVKNFY